MTKEPTMPLPETCPLCRHGERVRWFAFQGYPVVRCTACGLVMLDPQPSDATLAGIYDEAYFIGADDADLRAQANALKRGTAKLQLGEIAAAFPASGGGAEGLKMLEVGCGLGNFLIEARDAGFDVQGIDVSASAVASANGLLGEERARAGELQAAGFTPASFDIVVLADVLEHVRDPKPFMAHVRTLVKPGGLVFVALPSLDSLSARLMGRHWMEFKLEHLFYFDRRTVRRLLEDCGFERIAIGPGRKVLNLKYIIGHFEQFPVPVLTGLFRLAGRMLPERALHARFRVVASGIDATARVKS